MVSREVDIRNAKLMGGIGAILEIAGGFIPYLGSVLLLAGLVLELLALKKISDETGKPTIYKDFFASVIFAAIWSIFYSLSIIIEVFGSIPYMLRGSPSKGFEALHSLVFIIFGLIALGGLPIGAYFLRRSFNTTAEVTGEASFKTAATLIFYGAIFLIILVGGLLIFIGKIAEIVAFFSLPDRLEVSASS